MRTDFNYSQKKDKGVYSLVGVQAGQRQFGRDNVLTMYATREGSSVLHSRRLLEQLVQEDSPGRVSLFFCGGSCLKAQLSAESEALCFLGRKFE